MSNYINIIRRKSAREIFFRIGRSAKKRFGLLKREFSIAPKETPLLSLNDFRQKQIGYFFSDRKDLNIPKQKISVIESNALKIMDGQMPFFCREWIYLGSNYGWVSNPTTGFSYDRNKHWSEIDTLDKKMGDIKYVWEKSRFSYLYHIIRYDYHYDLDHSEFVFDEILDWIEKNPVNCGPNFVCSQEISIRITNWLFALFFYKNSEHLNETAWNKIIQSMYWQIRHVYSNINFSRIAVRNNHAITETLTLYLFGLMFPEMPGAYKWRKNGKKWFEQEIEYQFESDGTYLQQSMNYQRVVTQLLTWGIALAHLNGDEFSPIVYDNAYKSLNFLYQCMDKSSGWLPNYGANDGALLFPLSTADYRDYRPQLDALHRILTGENLFVTPYEDSLWINTVVKSYPPLHQTQGLVRFEKGGYFLIREEDTLTFIRCGSFRNRGTTDQLHIDVWHKGKNILLDGGSYRYNTTPESIKFFSGTESHNSIMLGDYDQMLKGPRFMWFFPPEILAVSFTETDSEYIFESTVRMFKHLNDGIVAKRIIKKDKNRPMWIIEDVVSNKPTDLTFRQLWHTQNKELKFNSTGIRRDKKSFVSSYYGVKESSQQIEFSTNEGKILTTIAL